MIQRIRGRVQIPDKTIKWLVFDLIWYPFTSCISLVTFQTSDLRPFVWMSLRSYPLASALTPAFFPFRIWWFVFLRKLPAIFSSHSKLLYRATSCLYMTGIKFVTNIPCFFVTNSQDALDMADSIAVGYSFLCLLSSNRIDQQSGERWKPAHVASWLVANASRRNFSFEEKDERKPVD